MTTAENLKEMFIYSFDWERYFNFKTLRVCHRAGDMAMITIRDFQGLQ